MGWGMNLLRFMTLIVCIPASTVVGQTPPTNFRIYPSAVTQTEPVIAISPTDSNLLFVSAATINTSNGFRSEGVYVSTNGGMTWWGTDTCTGQLISNHNGSPGVMIHPEGRFILTHNGLVFPGIYSHYSTDKGLSWSNAYTISSDQAEDKGSSGMDDHPSSPFYGRLYVAWVRLLIPFPLSFAYSTNAGSSWTAPAAVNGTPPSRCSGGSIAIARNGTVYVSWAGMTATTPLIEDFAGFAFSTDGGVSWSVTQNAFDMNGINGTLPEKGNIRVNGLPQIVVDNSGGACDGWLYIVTTQKNLAPAGSDPDIILYRSTNRGATWSQGIRVNQDALNNGKIQYFPAMDVDSFGGINIIYYDDRFTTSDSAEVIYARSMDGGNTWTERVISEHRFKPKPIVGGASNYQGDHIALKASGTKLYALWMDDDAGLYQVWMAILRLGPSAVSDVELPQRFELEQNYPNPFGAAIAPGQHATTIRFTVAGSTSSIRLQVFDVLGREVATLVNETRQPGIHTATFDGRNLPSGVYLYRLTAEGRSLTRKMLLVR